MSKLTITLSFRDRTLLRESLDENLSQVNNKLTPEYKQYVGPIAFKALERHRDELIELKKRIKR